MKKILLIDPLCYKGHVNYNAGIIRALSFYYDCDIIVNKFIYDQLRAKGFNKDKFIHVYPNEWNIETLSKNKNKVFYHLAFRFYFIKLLFEVVRVKRNYDAVFITCVDIYSYAFISWLLGNNIYVVDHGIGSLVDNKLYKLAWKITCKHTNIITLEGFIKQMVKKDLGRSNVFVVKHPLPEKKQETNRQEGYKTHYLIFAPSASNDESFLHKLSESVIPSTISIVAKSNSFEFDNGIVKIYNKYLPKSEYDYLLSNADYILLPYEPSYNYRISAIMFEALCMGTPILLLNNNTLKNYGEIFKERVHLFEDVEDMLGIIGCSSEFNCTDDDLDDYSDISIANSIKEILG